MLVNSIVGTVIKVKHHDSETEGPYPSKPKQIKIEEQFQKVDKIVRIIAGMIWDRGIEFMKKCECYHSSHSPYMFGLSPRMYDSNVRFSTVAQSKSRRS